MARVTINAYTERSDFIMRRVGVGRQLQISPEHLLLNPRLIAHVWQWLQSPSEPWEIQWTIWHTFSQDQSPRL